VPAANATTPKVHGSVAKVLSRAGRAKPGKLDAVWDPDLAKPVFSRDDKANCLNKHWGSVFQHKQVCQQSQERILEGYRTEFPQIDWKLNRSYLEHIIRHPKKSAPGPDGIPFSAFSAVADLATDILWLCARDLLEGGVPPPEFNHSTLVLLPKKPSVCSDGIQWFAPKDTRPLSIANADNRLISNVFREVLTRFADKTCRKEQRGFLSNRFLLENVVDVDFESRRMYLRGGHGGLVLVDLAAAFPSVSHDYLFNVLSRQGVPENIIQSVKMFYQGNQNFLSLDGQTSPAFTSKSGVRQGCPMSPVLFALALDPFLDYLAKALPNDSMVRAYADDMAVILPNLKELPILAKSFDLLGKAAGLQVNIDKTICIPLYPSTVMACKKDISHTSWAGMGVQIGYGKYLGFLVGPKATAENNFEGAMAKFRIRAQHWLSLKHLGAFFQVLGYNMFAVSVFSFIGQLYVLPPDFIKECRIISLKFMHGPRFWIHGVGGHAFFRAGEEVGFPAVPKCVESTGYQMLYNATLKHVPDFATKLLVLEETWKSGSLNCAAASHAINNSPYTHCRIVRTVADRVSIPQKLQAAPDILHLNRIIYDAFHDNIYKHGATITRLKSVYAKRWCKPHLISDKNVAGITLTAVKYLKWLARRVPPRVHIANTRFHFNGWHTKRRYQNRADKSCMFCKLGEDSIEHFVHCQTVNSLLPSYLKKGNPPKVPVAHFFLRDLDGKHRIIFALIVYGIYAIHNEFRHSTDHSDFKRCVLRVIADVPLRPEFTKAWKECLL